MRLQGLGFWVSRRGGCAFRNQGLSDVRLKVWDLGFGALGFSYRLLWLRTSTTRRNMASAKTTTSYARTLNYRKWWLLAKKSQVWYFLPK